MRAKILDAGTLSSVGPADVAAWLRGHGWLPTTSKSASLHRYLRFEKASGDEHLQVDVPESLRLRDYSRRMSEVLETLELVEGIDQLALVRDIRHAQVDVARLRLASAATEGGRIPVDQGATFFAAARDMMLAAACAALEHRPVFSKRKPSQAMEYLRNLRFGPTEEGSFVATVESPVPPSLQLGLGLVALDAPYERRVMATLGTALHAAHHATRKATATGTFEPFVEGISRGLNANLCDALAGMLEPFDASTLTVRIDWAPSRPSGSAPVEVALTRDHASLLREAGRVLKETEPVADFELEGVIVKLESDEPTQGGTIVVVAAIDGRVRRVRVALTARDYAQALEAHRSEREVAIDGELVREPGGHTLRNPGPLRIREPS
ncbi:MAG: hypothetical protein H6744_17680 [Deltaproteobacteria bacterium]|nr:hypothetical protein [Deltaproteobacteria bacterium]